MKKRLEKCFRVLDWNQSSDAGHRKAAMYGLLARSFERAVDTGQVGRVWHDAKPLACYAPVDSRKAVPRRLTVEDGSIERSERQEIQESIASPEVTVRVGMLNRENGWG